MLGRRTLQPLLGLCGTRELKALVHEEALLFQSAVGPAGFRLPAMSLSEHPLEPKSLIKA